MNKNIEQILTKAQERRAQISKSYSECVDEEKKTNKLKELNCISKPIKDYKKCMNKEGLNNLIIENQKKIDKKILPFKKYQMKIILTILTKQHNLNIEKGRCFCKYDEVFAISLALYREQWDPFFSQSRYETKNGKNGIRIRVKAGTKYADVDGKEQTIKEPIDEFFELKNNKKALPSKKKNTVPIIQARLQIAENQPSQNDLSTGNAVMLNGVWSVEEEKSDFSFDNMLYEDEYRL